MERKFKAVAMRFTQDEFDGMDKTGMTVYNVCDFSKHPYLINNYSGKELWVTNYSGVVLANNNRTVIETCNPKLFREYCGLENSVEEELKEATFNNKKEFRAIAMRCTQEDFDKMDKTGLDFRAIWSFEKYPYLTNHFKEEENIVSNIADSNTHFKIEFWDEDIFRICCGLEPKSKKKVDEKEDPKTFQTKDIQNFIEGNNKWADVRNFPPDAKFRFKPEPTKTLNTEIEALNQKAKEMGFKAVVTFESL